MYIDLILKSIINFAEVSKDLESDIGSYNNRIQNMGASLEKFVKSLFLDGNKLNVSNQEKIKEFSRIFSYQGAANNPPDLILRDGAAIEIKKRESRTAALPLNSSFPKNTLYYDDPKLKNDVRLIDGGSWKKDFFYYIGYMKQKRIESLFIMDGLCYSADKETYETLFNKIKEGIDSIDSIDFVETKELGKVKNIDPYNITDLRIRGMWNIKVPNSYLGEYLDDFNKDFKIYAIITKDKYEKANQDIRKTLENMANISVSFVKLPNPNNLSDLLDVVVIKDV